MSYGVKQLTTGTFNQPTFKISVDADATWTADIDTVSTSNYDSSNGDTTGLSFTRPTGAHLEEYGPQGQRIYYKNIQVSAGKITVNFIG